MIANTDLIVQLAIQIKNVILKHVNVTAKIVVHAKAIIIGVLAYAKHLKNIVDDSKIVWDKIMYFMDILLVLIIIIVCHYISKHRSKVKYKFPC